MPRAEKKSAILRHIAVVTLLFLLGTLRVLAGDPGFRRFAATISPDGAFVLAWGWGEDEQHLDQLREWKPGNDTADDIVANYLVDAATGRILATIPECDHFVTSDGRWKRFSGLSVSWSEDSEHALAIYEGRWSDEAILWIIPRTRAFIGVGKQLQNSYAAFLTKQIHLEDPGEISFSNVALLNDGMLVIDGRARPKVNEPPEYNYRLKFRVRINRDIATCTLLSGRKIAPDYSEKNEGDADKILNEAYQRLKAKLSESERAVLKQEQLRWLKQRAGMTNTVDRWGFTHNRATHLRARAED